MASTAGITSTDLLRDIRTEFLSTYRKVVGRDPRLAGCMRLGIASTKRTEYYGYHESPPELERWDRGKPMPEDAFLTRSFSVENLDWGKAINFHENDVEDLQLGDLRQTARRIGQRAAKLAQRIFYQIITAGTDASLLEAVPSAPDGAALYATTAAGAARFGATGGNIVTGNGVVAGQDVRGDFWSVMERFRQFQDTEGGELLDDEPDAGVIVCYNNDNDEVFHEAFKQERTVQIVQNAAVNENVAAAAVTNTIKETGLPITLWPTQRLSDNDWFVFLASDMVPKPVFEQLRQAPRTIEETRANSPQARRMKILSLLLDMRAGYGVSLPYGTIKVNN